MTELTRRQRERRLHRQQILEAAEEVFAREGFHAAGVQQIAEKAEFSVGYLYNLFESKEALYVELIGLRANEHLSEVEQRLDRAEGVLQKVRSVIEAKFDFFRRHRRFFDIFFTHLTTESRPRGPVFMPERCREAYECYLDRMRKVFEAGIRQGLFVDADPLTLVLCMEGMTRSIIAHWLYSGAEEGNESAPELVQQVLLEGILAEGAKDD
ncbi:MAG: TetR/AcrR family transcriptional regulator [Planctomycetota bacterium]